MQLGVRKVFEEINLRRLPKKIDRGTKEETIEKKEAELSEK